MLVFTISDIIYAVVMAAAVVVFVGGVIIGHIIDFVEERRKRKLDKAFGEDKK